MIITLVMIQWMDGGSLLNSQLFPNDVKAINKFQACSPVSSLGGQSRVAVPTSNKFISERCLNDSHAVWFNSHAS